MDQSRVEAEELLKPYLELVHQLEEADKLKQAQITALKLAIDSLRRQALDHKQKYDDEQKKEAKLQAKKATKK